MTTSGIVNYPATIAGSSHRAVAGKHLTGGFSNTCSPGVYRGLLCAALSLMSLQVHATLIGDEYFVTRHFQLADSTDHYAPSSLISAVATDGLGPEVSDFGSWRANMHVDVEHSSVIISERGFSWGGDGYITSFSSNNNFHLLEITDLNFSDPSLSIVGASLRTIEGETPVTDNDILFERTTCMLR